MVRDGKTERARRSGDRWRRIRRASRSRAGQWLGIGLGLLLLSGWAHFLAGVFPRFPATRRLNAPPVVPSRPESPFAASMGTAVRLYLRAEAASKQQLDALEEWDPDALNGSAPERYRRTVMARTRDLRLAEDAAREAERQAKSLREMYRAIELRARIDGDLGHHREELAEARKLVALEPRDPGALMVLERAAKGDGQMALARQAEAKLGELQHPQATRMGSDHH